MGYPTSLDNLLRPDASQNMDTAGYSGPEIIDAISDGIEALEAKVGVNGSSVTSSHDYKLSGVTGIDKAVSLTGTETLSNKTLTSPTISAPSISNGTASGLALTGGSLTGATITGPTISSGTASGLALTDPTFVLNSTLTIGGVEIGTSGGIVIPNDKAYKIKDSGGTNREMIKLTSSDEVHIGTTAEDLPVAIDSKKYVAFSTNLLLHTTSTRRDQVLIQSGWSFIQGDGTNNSLQTTVTFPKSYENPPMVVCGVIGYKNGADPANPGDTQGLAVLNFDFVVYDTTTSVFYIQLIRRSIDGTNPGVLVSGRRYMFSWIAMETISF